MIILEIIESILNSIEILQDCVCNYLGTNAGWYYKIIIFLHWNEFCHWHVLWGKNKFV